MVLRTFRARAFKARTFAPIIGLPETIIPIPPEYYTIRGGISGRLRPDKIQVGVKSRKDEEEILMMLAYYVMNILNENNNYV